MIPLANEFGGGLVIYLIIILPFVAHIEMGIVEYYVAEAKKSPEEIQKILEAIKHRLNTTILNLLSVYDIQFRHGIVKVNHHFTRKHSLTIIGISTAFILIGTAALVYGLLQSPIFWHLSYG